MKIALLNQLPKNFKGSLMIPLFESQKLGQSRLIKLLSPEDRSYITRVASSIRWSEKEVRSVPLPSNPARYIILLGLGEKKKWQPRKLVLATRRVVKALKDNRLKLAAVSLAEIGESVPLPDSSVLSLVVQNLLLAELEFTAYKERPKEGWPKIEEIALVANKITPVLKKAHREGIVLGEEINLCRQLANMPGGLLSPSKLVERARVLAKSRGFKVKVLGRQEMKRLGMGGILAVAQGSIHPPEFLILEYGSGKKPPLVLVGKGVTFDAGGLNLKPAEAMLGMNMDKSGGAAVLHAISAIARLKLPVHIIGLIPAVETLPSGSRYKPGDLLQTITGQTIEVINTDAEGRIILADALGYAQKFKPSLIVDLATLTGAAMMALGQRVNALFANQEKLYRLSEKVGEEMGDYVWPLPLWEEYEEEIKGTFGDFANLGKTKYGGAITGAIFLKQFVGDFPWIHVDIAPLMTTIEGQYLAKGASGTGVAFLVGMAKKIAESR